MQPMKNRENIKTNVTSKGNIQRESTSDTNTTENKNDFEFVYVDENNETNKGSNSKKKKKKPLSKRIILFLREMGKIVIILAICAGIGIFTAIGVRDSDPKKIVEKYFTSYITNNYKDMYSLVEMKKSDFINMDAFITKCSGERVYGSLKEYEVKQVNKTSKSITYNVSYYLYDDETEYTYTITLNKQSHNLYLFFDNWKVDISDIIKDSIEIYTPVGNSAILDGVSLDKYSVGTSEDGTKSIYKTGPILMGDHTLMINTDNIGAVTKSQYITADDTTMEFAQSDFTMRASDQEEISKMSMELLQKVYENAMDSKKKYSNIKDLFYDDAQVQTDVETVYNQFHSEVQKENGNRLKQIEMTDMTSAIDTYTYPDKATVEIQYAYNFSAVTGRTILSGITKKYTGEGSASAKVHFSLINDAWKITGIEIPCIDFSQQ